MPFVKKREYKIDNDKTSSWDILMMEWDILMMEWDGKFI